MFSSYVKYGEEEKNNTLLYYIWANSEEYYRVGDKLARANTRSSALALTIVKDRENDLYNNVAGHQLPDPKRTDSLQKLFPPQIVNKVNVKTSEIQKRTLSLTQENTSKAQDFFGISPRFNVEEVKQEKCLNLTFQNFVSSQIQGNEVVDVVFDQSSLPSLESWTAARSGIEQVHTFDRRYTIKSIGCGKKCFDHRIIDTRTSTEVKHIRSQYGLDFGDNSALLVVNPYHYILDPEPQGVTTQFYVMNETDPNHPRLELRCSYTDRGVSPTVSPSLDIITSTDKSASQEINPSTANPNRRYLNHNADECAAMNITCADNESFFTDNTGCGCELTTP